LKRLGSGEHGLQGNGLPFDEPRHQIPLGLHDGHHLRAHPDGGRHAGRRLLGAAIDAEQFGVLPADPKNHGLAVDLDLVVVVRDPSAEGLVPGMPPGPEPLDDRFGIHGPLSIGHDVNGSPGAGW